MVDSAPRKPLRPHKPEPRGSGWVRLISLIEKRGQAPAKHPCPSQFGAVRFHWRRPCECGQEKQHAGKHHQNQMQRSFVSSVHIFALIDSYRWPHLPNWNAARRLQCPYIPKLQLRCAMRPHQLCSPIKNMLSIRMIPIRLAFTHFEHGIRFGEVASAVVCVDYECSSGDGSAVL